MSILAKRCPKCCGCGKVPNLLLPGKHLCRRCDGLGELPTIWSRLLGAAASHLSPDTLED